MHKNILEECKSKRNRKEVTSSTGTDNHDVNFQRGSSSLKSDPTNFKQKVHISSFLVSKTLVDGGQYRSVAQQASVTDVVESSRIVAEIATEDSKQKLLSDIGPPSGFPNHQPNAQKDPKELLGKRSVEFDTSILPTALIQPTGGPQNYLRLEQPNQTIAIPYARVMSSMRPITIGPSSSTPFLRDQPFTTQTSAFVHPDASRLSPKPRTIPANSISGAGSQNNLKIQTIVLSPDQETPYIMPNNAQTRTNTQNITVPHLPQKTDGGNPHNKHQTVPFFSIPQPETLQFSQLKSLALTSFENRFPVQPATNCLTQRPTDVVPLTNSKTKVINLLNKQQSCHQQQHAKTPNSSQANNEGHHEHLDGTTYFRFEEHLERLCKQLCALVRPPAAKVCSLPQREAVYSAVMRLVENFQLVPVNSELLVKKKVGRYFGLLHSLLRDINDQQSDLYSKLFMETDLLLKQLRSLAMKFVDAQVLLSTKSARRTLFQPPIR